MPCIIESSGHIFSYNILYEFLDPDEFSDGRTDRRSRFVRKIKNEWIVICMTGFLCGILYANFCARKFMNFLGIFRELYLTQYRENQGNMREYFWYLLKNRMGFMCGLAMATTTKLKKLICILFLWWTSFSVGYIMVSSVLKMGIGGIWFCVLSLVPQFLFYAVSVGLILRYMYEYPSWRWNRYKTMFVILMFLAGIFVESYLSPKIIYQLLRILL